MAFVIVTAPNPPGSKQLISPPAAVFEIAPAKVLHGAVRLHGLTSSPTPDTHVRVACAWASEAKNPQAATTTKAVRPFSSVAYVLLPIFSMSNECTEGESCSKRPNRSPKGVPTNVTDWKAYDYLGLNGQLLGKLLARICVSTCAGYCQKTERQRGGNKAKTKPLLTVQKRDLRSGLVDPQRLLQLTKKGGCKTPPFFFFLCGIDIFGTLWK